MGYHVVRHRGLDVPVGRGAAGVRLPDRGAARRGGLPGRAGLGAGGVLRAGRARASPSAGGAGRSRSSARSRPPGGDMTEPVTAHTQRFVRSRVDAGPGPGLRAALPGGGLVRVVLPGRRRAGGLARAARETRAGRAAGSGSLALLAEADRLAALAELVGVGAMPGAERVVMLAGRLLREGVLQQSALSANDAFCSAGQGRRAARRRPRGRRPLRGARRRRGAAPRRSRRSTSGRCCGPRRRPAPTTSTGVRAARATPMLARLEAAAHERGPDRCGSGRVHRRDASCAGRCSSSAACAASAGTSSRAIRLDSGEVRHGLVLEVDRDLAVVQVLEGTDGMRPGRHPRRASPARRCTSRSAPAGWAGSATAGASRVDGGPPVAGAAARAGRPGTR